MYRKTTKVLPTTYDDSLSYYEILNKLSARVNELYEILEGTSGEYIKKLLDEIIFRCTYDKVDECIIFAYEEIPLGDDIHIYNEAESTLYIKSKE